MSALNSLLKVLIIAMNAQSHSVDAPSPLWFGGGDHFRSLFKASDTFNVTRLPKVDFLVNCEDFRGISVTLVIARAFERTVYNIFNKTDMAS